MDIKQAKEILKNWMTAGDGLNSQNAKNPDEGRYVWWRQGDQRTGVDGEFTADELEAIAVLMRNGRKEILEAASEVG